MRAYEVDTASRRRVRETGRRRHLPARCEACGRHRLCWERDHCLGWGRGGHRRGRLTLSRGLGGLDRSLRDRRSLHCRSCGGRVGRGRCDRLRLVDERRRRWDGLRGGRGEQAERVDIAVGIRGEPDAEVDMRSRRDRVGALADVADDSALRDEAAAHATRRTELQQRHRIAVGGLDRQRPTAARDRADERDHPRRRGKHGASELGADVDAAVLPARVVVRAERERSQDRPRRWPRPGARRRCCEERREQNQDREDSPHE